jgi:hypothetical protein
LGEEDLVLPGVQALPELRPLGKLDVSATIFNYPGQPSGSTALRLLDGAGPEREHFPLNIPFPAFQKGWPRYLSRLAFGLASGFTLNLPFE